MDTKIIDQAVRARYSAAAGAPEAALCCPVDYDPRYLEIIPDEVLEKDYGCGDPSKYLRAGETVLDLGSGGGKICFIAAQVVGTEGRVIGVDNNDDMLALARRHQPLVAERLGFDNVTFVKGRIEDLAPIVDDGSVDVVVSNCVLNLVSGDAKHRLFREIHRVLRRGGRAVISDIVSDEPIPDRLKADPELWSGCVSGAMLESEFLRAFEEAGLYGIELVTRGEKPWRVVEGIEFWSYTVAAYKGKEGPCLDHLEAVIYRGPFRQATDDDGHTYHRGERTAVCRKTFEILMREPYAEHFEPVNPREAVADPAPFRCEGGTLRPPRVTKGAGHDETPQDCEPACC